MTDAAPHPISFGEFGVRFIHAAFTPERIQAKFKEHCGPIPEEAFDTGKPFTTAYVSGALTDVSVEEMTPGDTDPDAAYAARLDVKLHVRIEVASVLNGSYEGSFVVPFKLKLVALTPLALQLNPYYIAPEDINAVLTAQDPFAGLIEGAVHDEVVKSLASKVNMQLGAAQADMHIDLMKMLTDMDKPADPATPPPADAVVRPISTDIANPVPLGAGESFRGELPEGSHAYFRVGVDPALQFNLAMGARVSNGSIYSASFGWRLVDFDENLLDSGNSLVISDTENFEKITATLHGEERLDTALLVLKAESNPLTVRGKLSFEPWTG